MTRLRYVLYYIILQILHISHLSHYITNCLIEVSLWLEILIWPRQGWERFAQPSWHHPGPRPTQPSQQVTTCPAKKSRLVQNPHNTQSFMQIRVLRLRLAFNCLIVNYFDLLSVRNRRNSAKLAESCAHSLHCIESMAGDTFWWDVCYKIYSFSIGKVG